MGSFNNLFEHFDGTLTHDYAYLEYFAEVVSTSIMFISGSWYHFNDSCVSLVSEEAVARCKAYILFYTRRHPETAVVEKIKGKLIS